MSPILLQLYGPFAINAYGLFIALGLMIALLLARKDPRKQSLITDDEGITLLSGGIIAGIFGGRILHLLMDPSQFTSWYDLIAFWEGGFAELGSLITVTIFLITYLYYKKISLLPLLDLIGTYAPLMQSFGRIGCFFAGCCYGAPTTVAWSVTYTHPASLAPLHQSLHPTQLYSAFLFFCAFMILYAISSTLTKPGQCFMLYIMATSSIRFMVDFWRDDRIFTSLSNSISSYQLLALGIFLLGAIGFMVASSHERSFKNEAN